MFIVFPEMWVGGWVGGWVAGWVVGWVAGWVCGWVSGWWVGQVIRDAKTLAPLIQNIS